MSARINIDESGKLITSDESEKSSETEKSGESKEKKDRKDKKDKGAELQDLKSKLLQMLSGTPSNSMHSAGSTQSKKSNGIEQTQPITVDLKTLNTWLKKATNYHYGRSGVQINLNWAFMFYVKAAEAGHVASTYNAFLLLLNHPNSITSIKTDNEKNKRLKEYLEVCVTAGVPEAKRHQAEFYLEGFYGYPQDKKTGLNILEQLAREGHDQASFSIAVYLEKHGETQEESKRTLEICQDLSKKNYPPALVRLGDRYASGNGVTINLETAFSCYRKAARLKENYGFALWRLANCYLEGSGVEADPRRGLDLLKNAVKTGEINAIFQTGQILEEGVYNEKSNPEIALELYRSIEMVHPLAKCKIGMAHLFGQVIKKDPKLGFEKIVEAAASGDGNVIYNLGLCYFYGIGIPKNPIEAYACFRKAYDAGYLNAALNMSHALETGVGTDKNPQEAFTLINRLANEDHSNQHSHVLNQSLINRNPYIFRNKLATFYLTGTHVKEDIEYAATLFQKIVDDDKEVSCPEAYLNLAVLYRNGKDNLGRGINQDYVRAFELLKKACLRGSALAYFLLSQQYLEGQGCESDVKQSFDCLEKAETIASAKPFALHSGNQEEGRLLSDLHTTIGDHYLFGMGVERNFEKAVHSFQLAAEKGKKDAITALGFCYMFGLGVPSDKTRACQLFEQAERLGSVDARNSLGWCLLNGLGAKEDKKRAIELFRQGVEMDPPSEIAIKNLAWCYLLGVGVPQNVVEAEKLFNQTSSRSYFGICYKHEAFTIVASDEIQNAKHQLGMAICKLKGFGVECDQKGAFEFIVMASKSNLLEAKILLAQCYLFGHGTPKNEIKGFQLLQQMITEEKNRASKTGEKLPCSVLNAMLELAQCFEDGLGTRKDLRKALSLYQESAEQGYLPAQHNFERLDEILNPKTMFTLSFSQMVANGRGDEAKGKPAAKRVTPKQGS